MQHATTKPTTTTTTKPSKGKATKPTAPAVQATAPAAADLEVQAASAALGALAGVLETLAGPTVQAAQPAAPVPAVPVLVPATYAGLPFASLPKSNQAFALAKRAPSMPTLPGTAVTTVGAKAYKVRTAHTQHWFAALLAAGCGTPQGATLAQLQAAVASGALCPKFLGYAVNRGWLVAAQA
jgi:hypothetical protein